ncbi:protein kinase [Euzebya sp.]|uniref:serine/threonine-protein kinase n=1 Tax=Euzebya sp. TaxID=1971409 RepID=UPI0035195058
MRRRPPLSGPVTSDLLANRYVLEEHIAVGGMAAVWRAHDEVLARTVAIKILHDDLSREEAIRERFRREAVAAAKLVHPGIVSLFDTGVDGGRVYLVIEYVEGRTLADVLATEVLEPEEVARMASRIASALAHAHDRGIIHRDVKPANVLLSAAGAGGGWANGAVKVTDFGIAKAAQDSTLTAPGRVMGTAAYVAPEQLRGHEIDARADLYSLGLVMYEAMTGERAFSGGDPISVAEARLGAGPLHPRQLRADVPKALDDVVAALTAPEPADRPASAAAVVELLRPFAADRTVPPALPAAEEDDEGTSLRSELRWLAPVGGLLLLAAALVAVGIVGGIIDDDRISLSAEEVTPDLGAGGADADPIAEAGRDAGAGEGGEEPAPQVVPLRLGQITAFDPQGDGGGERDEFLPNLTDGAPNTAWATERYDTPQFGNLKDGVGFHVDLSGSRTLAEVVLEVPRGGFDVEIRVAGRVDPDPAAWVTATTIDDIAPGRSTYPLPENPTARYLLVWITGDLQPFETGFRAEIGEIEVQALAS